MKRVLRPPHSPYLLLLAIILPAALLPGGAAAARMGEAVRLMAAIEVCLQAYDSRIDADDPDGGMAAIVIAEDCPKLAYYMENTDIAGSLHPPLPDTVGDWELLLFQSLVDASQWREHAGGYDLNHAGLDELLSGIYKPAAAPAQAQGWWTAFREWLRGFFPKMGDSPQLHRLAGWLDALLPSERTVKFLIYGLLAALILVALVILLLEIRAAGLWAYIRTFSRGRNRKQSFRLPQQDPDAPSLEAIHRLPLSARAPALLKLCIALLARAGFVETGRGLTNRELLCALQRRHPALSPPFEMLVNYAESYVYGGRPATAEGVSDSFESAARIVHAAGV